MTRKIDPRIERNIEATYTLRDLLRLIVKEPHRYAHHDELLSSLRSQGRTAKLQFQFSDENGIRSTQPMAKNSLEKYSNDLFDRGYDGIEDLRKGALDAILSYREREKGANKRTKSGLQKKVKELENQLEAYRKTNFILLQGLSEALYCIKNIRDSPNAAVKDKRANDALGKLRAIVSLNAPPFDQLDKMENVFKMKEGKREKI